MALEPLVLPKDTPTATCEHGQLKAAFLETFSFGLCDAEAINQFSGLAISI